MQASELFSVRMPTTSTNHSSYVQLDVSFAIPLLLALAGSRQRNMIGQ